jgi:NitT/TauT family transport system ATP-binding protein
MPEAGPAGAALTLKGVRIAARGAILVDRFDFSLEAGEAAALVGPPGCGKTRLLRLAAGLDRPEEGERHVAASRSSFVFQSGGLVRNITVEENLLLPLYYLGLGYPAARKRAVAALEDFGLSAVADQRPGELLNETRLLAQFARAAALDSDLLFLDEPFSQLSRPVAARVEHWLKGEVGKGRLAVMMTGVERQAVPHIPTRILELSGSGTPPPKDLAVGVAP